MAALLRYKLLGPGSAPNGDWFAIDFSTESCGPGFVSHELLSPWGKEPLDPRPYFQPVARTIESFLYRVVEEKYLQIDYHAAEGFNEFLAAEREVEPGAAPEDGGR